MKQVFKNAFKTSIQYFTRKFSATRVGKIVNEVVINDVMHRVYNVSHNELKLKFAVPNIINRYRAESFSSKEPETLEWIDRIPDGAVLWDIGANVGLYSVYAAKRKNCRVFAFEPSVFNLELLARNLFLNGLQEKVVILPLALSNSLGSSMMNMTMIDWGGACSTFGKDVGWDGKSINNIFAFRTFGITMDQALSLLDLPVPDFIKMDVDGIEHFILQGGPQTLDSVQGILVEINDDFIEQAEQTKISLEAAGLHLLEKKHSELIENSKYKSTFNQIWVRN